MCALLQQDRAVLHQGKPMLALSTADDFVADAQNVADGVLLKAKDIAMLDRGFVDKLDFAAESDLGERRRDNAMHAQ